MRTDLKGSLYRRKEHFHNRKSQSYIGVTATNIVQYFREIRNPLTAVMGFDTLEKGEYRPDTSRCNRS
ncbi:hypothetical protein JFU50_07530 [Peribacillus sp. TH14]|nr:hypothetical protein [Peribacillus sp. TH14]